VAAHGVQVDARDRERLAKRGVHVVLCPRSNERLGVGTADAPAAPRSRRAAGARQRQPREQPVARRARGCRAAAAPVPAARGRNDPALATLGGAEALGFTELGAIEPGRRAAFAYAPANEAPRDPEAFLLSGEARLERVAIAVPQLQP
jgi:cytosine/adenosine deaminase-related metal-dependent hydrolase